MKATVRINLMKWDQCKAIGEKPEAFIERINWHIEATRKNGLRMYYEEYEKERDAHRKEWLEGCIKYEERKMRRYEKEIKKAQAEMN